MNDVPLLFAETVARLLDNESLSSLKHLSSSHFGNVGRSLWKKQLFIYLNVVYNSKAKTLDYCLRCRSRNGNSDNGPYSYDPADYRFVRYFGVRLFKDRNSLNNLEVTWMTVTSSDPTFLKLLRTSFARTFLFLDTNCFEGLKLLPDYCTFNWIYASEVYNEVLDAIIDRSQECGRLEEVDYREFFTKRGREASITWIATNKRLQQVSSRSVRNFDSIGAALTAIGVQ